MKAVRVAPGLPNWAAGVICGGIGRPVMWPLGCVCPLVTGLDTAAGTTEHGTVWRTQHVCSGCKMIVRNSEVSHDRVNWHSCQPFYKPLYDTRILWWLVTVQRHQPWLNEKWGVVPSAMLAGWLRGLWLALYIDWTRGYSYCTYSRYFIQSETAILFTSYNKAMQQGIHTVHVHT